MQVIDTPLRLFAELDLNGSLAGRFQQEFQRQVKNDDGAEVMAPQILVKDLTSEEGAAVLESEAANKAAQIQALSKQIAACQEQLKAQAEAASALVAKLQAEVQTLKAFVSATKDANQAWDTTVLPLLKGLP